MCIGFASLFVAVIVKLIPTPEDLMTSTEESGCIDAVDIERFPVNPL